MHIPRGHSPPGRDRWLTAHDFLHPGFTARVRTPDLGGTATTDEFAEALIAFL
ncbi:hypothetical protein ACFWMG_06600 [Streptomyces sp. NPDC127074]|uniref:hypothetical protein n=1 Tax=Streptomyces sp. NPDC127074 TaxID=3347130 RepID=UPI00364B043A